MKNVKYVILAGVCTALGAGLHYLYALYKERQLFDDCRVYHDFGNGHGYDDDEEVGEGDFADEDFVD